MGAGASVPEQLDAATAQRLAGDEWDAQQFNNLAVDGKVTSEQWNECVMKHKMKKAMGPKKVIDADVLEETKRKQAEVEAKLRKVEEEGGEQWVEVFDPASEQYFYRASITGEVVWEKPAEYVMAADDKMMAAAICIQTAWRGKLARQKIQGTLAQKKKNVKAHKAAAKQIAIIEKKIEDIKLLHNVHWVEVFEPEKERYRFYDTTSGYSVYEPPEHYIMLADEDTLVAVIRIQCCFRCKLARKRARAQVALLESRAHDHVEDDSAVYAANQNLVFDNQLVYVDAEDYDPHPIVVSPPGMPHVPTARAVSATEVDLRWEQPETGGAPLTFNNIRIRPVIPNKKDKVRVVQIEVPAQVGEAVTIVGELLTGRSYTFQVQARNIEGYGPWSTPSDIAVPLDPDRFHHRVEVYMGSTLGSILMGEIKVSLDTTLDEARELIETKLGAVNDGWVPTFTDGQMKQVASKFHERWPIEWDCAKGGGYVFTRGDDDLSTVAIDRRQEPQLRAIDLKPKGTQMKDEDGDGEVDLDNRPRLYLQPLRRPTDHGLPIVKNVEIHVRKPKYVVDNIEIDARGEVHMLTQSVSMVDTLSHGWDKNHVVVKPGKDYY